MCKNIKSYVLLLIIVVIALSIACVLICPFESNVCVAETRYDHVYTYTKYDGTSILDADVFHYKVDDIEEGFGHLTQTYNVAKNGYSINAKFNGDYYINCIKQVIAIEEESGVSFEAEPSYLYGIATVILEMQNVTREAGDFPFNAITSDGNYYDNKTTEDNLDDDVMLFDVEYWLRDTVVTVESEFDVKGEMQIIIFGKKDELTREYVFHFSFSSIHLEPIVDGSLIALTTSYQVECDDDGVQNHSMHLDIIPTCVVFSEDDSDSCFIMDGLNYELPGQDCEISFIYNGVMGLSNTGYSYTVSEVQDIPYTMQGKLDFRTRDGNSYTLYTNIVTIRKHNVELRIDGTKDYRVGVNVKHEYSFVIDNNDVDYAEKSIGWYRGYSDPINYNSEKINYAFSEIGETELIAVIEIEINNYEEITLYGLRFPVNVLAEEPNREYPSYEIKFNINNDSAALLGGDSFEVSASINDVYGDEHFQVSLTASGSSIAVVSNEGAKLVVVPIEIGRSVIYCNVTSKSWEQ